MSILSRGLTAAFDVVFYPLRWLSPVAGLSLVAFVTAVVALVVIKRTSDQVRVRQAKDDMFAALLEMRLFNDDLAAILRAQVDVFAANARYLRASLRPAIWLLVPFVIVMAELDAFYATRGLTPHVPAIVTAHVRGGASIGPASLDAAPGLTVDTPAIWFPETREMVWRVTPEREGDYPLELRAAGDATAKTVVVSDAVVRRSPARVAAGAAGWMRELENSSEPPLPDASPFDEIAVEYPARDLRVLGWHLPWLLVYGGLVVVFGFGLGRIFHVEI